MGISRLRAGLAAFLLAAGVALTGCDAIKQGAENLSGGMNNPFEINGASSATGPSGLRPGVPDTTLTAVNAYGGTEDRLALNAMADLQEFWSAEYSKTFPGTFEPPSGFLSWDASAARSRAPDFCGETTFEQINAAYCTVDRSIGWDRGVLLPELVSKFGPMSVVMVMAHEYGHALQAMARLNGMRTPTVVLEQQADCFEGVFLHHVAEGNSRHFTINTTDGLNGVLGATIAVRDQEPGASENEHGTAFERVTAVQIGYTEGAQACVEIDRAELAQRRGTLPTSFLPGEESAQLPVDRTSLDLVGQTLARAYPVQDRLLFDYTGVAERCANVTATEPVSYCPADSTIGMDVPDLARLSRGNGDGEILTADVSGDYTAFILLISRYMLAVQQDRDLGVTGAETAGLRAACLSGAFTTTLSEPGSDIRLSADDLDEAVSGLLSDGLAASDVNGEVVASGFVRLEAFRTGVLDGEGACLSAYQ
ncbi:metallopeptidase [Nocardia crassostreae]|uniref:metallopeptidase n=1 Tax=Nocardia crassostreae TaxID=53428 RepID=UPI00082EDFFF|nr:metallopeptidase [Nocardia crassostreae]